MRIWQLGNTSVRSAMRIRDGLVALSTSSIQGNIRGAEGDKNFRNLLGEKEIVTLGEDRTYSVGRKWRSAMGKLGLIYPQVYKRDGFSQDDLGPLDTITPAGWHLIRAETVPAMQECYLRAMVTPLFQANNEYSFSGLSWTLAILLELELRGEEPAASFLEMALIIQTTDPTHGLTETVDRILDLRARKKAAENKRRFDSNEYERVAKITGKVSQTFRDYADMNIRYLKATGMVQAKGKGIVIVPEKHYLSSELTKHLLSSESLLIRLRSICNGTPLPTDDTDVAHQVLGDLLKQTQNYNISYSVENRTLDTPAEINLVRYEIEELISEKKEEIYAREQADQWQEIAAYMDLLASRRNRQRISEDLEISIPSAEAPAYLEWSLWRAILALNQLQNKPFDVRRFKIDQDFMPISTAPGNGPDLIAEFEEYVVVVEVTLSESSRQEAMEGEPVRRHVANLMMQYDKPVYGLFIANRIDSNTAETFRIGVWYTSDDERLDLHIVPITLSQFSSLFKTMFTNDSTNPATIINLMKKCESYRQVYEAPEWKNVIEQTIHSAIETMT